MRIKHTYKVATDLHLQDSWPIDSEKFLVNFEVSEKRVIGISVESALPNDAFLPSITSTPNDSAKAQINIAKNAIDEEIRSYLLSVQGILSLFTSFKIEFLNAKLDWIPENEEEKSKLKLVSFGVQLGENEDTPNYLPFDLVAKATFSAPRLAGIETPLNFFRCGDRDLKDQRHIDAFYSFFFFLETLYAPGFSDPKKVKEKLRSSPEILAALREMRETNDRPNNRTTQKIKNLLAKNDVDLISHLVDVRGNLHHHALKRKGVWHPDRSHEYEGEAAILQEITHTISMNATLSAIYSPSADQDFRRSLEKADTFVKLEAHVTIVTKGSTLKSEVFPVKIAGTRATPALVNFAYRKVREAVHSMHNGATLSACRITSNDGTKNHAMYSTHLLRF